MTVPASKRLANARYNAAKRSHIAADLPKDRAQYYKAKAAELGLSMSQLIQHAIDSYVGNESVLAVPTTTTEPALTSEQRKILDAFDALPEDTKKALIKVLFALSKQSDNA